MTARTKKHPQPKASRWVVCIRCGLSYKKPLGEGAYCGPICRDLVAKARQS